MGHTASPKLLSFMALLPQTAAGVPFPGVDPTLQELAEIQTIDHVLLWLGSPHLLQPLSSALGATPMLRDVVFVPQSTWDSVAGALRIPPAPAADAADAADADPLSAVVAAAPRPLNPIELGHFHQVRRISRLRLGLTAKEEVPGPAATTPAGIAFGGPAPATPAVGVNPEVSVVSQPQLRLSSVADPTLDSLLVRLPGVRIRALFTACANVRGKEPGTDIEPSVEQISAVHQIIGGDMPPYVDFSIFGPHGRRMLTKLTYFAYTHLPDGSWQRNSLPGPSTFELWWAAFRVLRCTLLLLEVVPPEILDAYGEFIREQNTAYGPDAWFLVYQADVRMRSEHFDRIRRRAERAHHAAQTHVYHSTFKPEAP